MKCVWAQKPNLHFNGTLRNSYSEYHFSIYKPCMFMWRKLYLHFTICIENLIVVTIGPQDSDTDHILFEFVCTSHVRTRQIAQATRIYLERLVYGKLHGKINYR